MFSGRNKKNIKTFGLKKSALNRAMQRTADADADAVVTAIALPVLLGKLLKGLVHE